jgi:hypothetical protein
LRLSFLVIINTSSNQETYIVAQNTANSTSNIYSTLQIDLSATEELEYNNQGAGVWNECAWYATSKSNVPTEDSGCNMRYDSVGFNAFIPLNELFPDSTVGGTWRLYIVKKVNGHMVYSPIILPFTFADQSFNGGKVSLTSGVNANNLQMVGNPVIRRPLSRCTTCKGATYGYFTQWNTYSRTNSDESGTTVWYGVASPEDGWGLRWASTAY